MTQPVPRPFRLMPAALAFLVLVALCTAPAAGITAADDSGQVIVLDGVPQRIVSLSPSNTEILAALGLSDRIVGVTDVCDYPPGVKNKTRIGGYAAISIEKVALVQPDLVIASDITPEETVQRLRSLGLPVAVVAPRNIGHMIRDIRMVGALTGTEGRAGELADELAGRMETITRCPSGTPRPTVAHVVWHQPLYVSGNDTLQNDVIVSAGGINVFADRSGWSTIPLEEFLARNPDIIIVSGGGGMDAGSRDVIFDAFTTGPQFSSLAAVKNHRVYAVNADIISRPAPRIVNATEQVARIVRPTCFSAGAVPSPAPTVPARSPGFAAGCAVLVAAFAVFLCRSGGGRR